MTLFKRIYNSFINTVLIECDEIRLNKRLAYKHMRQESQDCKSLKRNGSVKLRVVIIEIKRHCDRQLDIQMALALAEWLERESVVHQVLP